MARHRAPCRPLPWHLALQPPPAAPRTETSTKAPANPDAQRPRFANNVVRLAYVEVYAAAAAREGQCQEALWDALHDCALPALPAVSALMGRRPRTGPGSLPTLCSATGD